MAHQNETSSGLPGETGRPARARMDGTGPMRDVEGKVAFITGGDSGIGLGIARVFIRSGMKVVITYRSTEHLDEAKKAMRDAGDRLHAINVDVTDRAAMVLAAQETVRVFGKVHVLVNNAGVGPMVGLSNATFDDWDWCMGVNVNGVFNGVRAFLPHLRTHGEGGHIVATSSMLGGLLAGPFWGVYSTSKFAVLGMMEALRSELADTNIGVSVFCPAGVSTSIGSSERNRPASLDATAAPDPGHLVLMERFNKAVTQTLKNAAGSPMIDPLEAGESVLGGIQNNDLYIISHPEYEQALRDRYEALMMSIPTSGAAPSDARVAFARAVRNSLIYTYERKRKDAQHRP